ncbi:MAG TPA: dicarboxylate/amino acid:cation symporter [Leptospiraceae bacterium]|nr:dicarboxylate/amino acid:cation symporter [Leptospiraceae bacterium]HMZ58780.1 dicarboxylate/amino acid:cation symporter [Leptospiraceae bacterium]HNF27466.1 dicarboxylate/amino acid:cation symporter [Leptospiraceae bacterium]HNH07648.1 dicarboxylate/amino acid:cation symporter [Leptospiraceae bacterium]HNM04797.1 dicarboxylate/amino acid:cation symporter [Leptospiraceae bacterium]
MTRKIYSNLYFQVILGIAAGITLGFFHPDLGAKMRPLGDGFIRLIKMVISPIIFITVVTGIAKVGSLKSLGRVGLKSLIYFEVISTLALIIGMAVLNVYEPGKGMNVNPAALDTSEILSLQNKAHSTEHRSTVGFILGIIPNQFLGAFTEGSILQVLFISVLFGVAMAESGAAGERLLEIIEEASTVFFRIISMIMKLAPVGAFGAMAFTVSSFGAKSLIPMLKLMGSLYFTCFLFIFTVLGLIARLAGFSIWKFLKFIRQELLIVLGTSSSESVLPRIMKKLEAAGCGRSVVGLTIPTGYSFNLDGTSIYLTMAALFIAQATNVNLSLEQQISILGILLLTSKGAAAVTGAGLVTLAATLSTIETLPVNGIALIIGIDRFMSEARSITNLIGNAVATVVISKWENALDSDRLDKVLSGEIKLPEYDSHH